MHDRRVTVSPWTDSLRRPGSVGSEVFWFRGARGPLLVIEWMVNNAGLIWIGVVLAAALVAIMVAK